MNKLTPVEPQLLDPTLISALRGMGAYNIQPCGSRITCDPPVMDTDEDWLVVHSGRRADEIAFMLQGAGWDQESVNYDDSYFASWRKGRVNLLITSDETWADRHRAATFLCKRLNLMVKADRIALFRAVLYSEFCSWVRPEKGFAPDCTLCRGSGLTNQGHNCATCGGSGVAR